MSDKPPVSDTPAPGAPPLVATGAPLVTRNDQTPVEPTETRDGAAMPSFPPSPAAKLGTNTQASPSGPGTPIDGSISVNTYTPEDVQAKEKELGIQDWQSAVATPIRPVNLPEEPEPEPAAQPKAAEQDPPKDENAGTKPPV